MGEKKCNQLIEKREKRVTIGNASGLIEPDWLEILQGNGPLFITEYKNPKQPVLWREKWAGKYERENMSGTKWAGKLQQTPKQWLTLIEWF